LILYLDTSSLVKLYLDEAYTDSVRMWVGSADLLATSRLTLPETAAAVARRERTGTISARQRDRTMADLQRDWDEFVAVELDEWQAASLALRHRLRGFDAVQLAAALTLQRGAGPEELAFSSFDDALNECARAEGLTVLEPMGG
jgi:predicted nucleic acid-binding protein